MEVSNIFFQRSIFTVFSKWKVLLENVWVNDMTHRFYLVHDEQLAWCGFSSDLESIETAINVDILRFPSGL